MHVKHCLYVQENINNNTCWTKDASETKEYDYNVDALFFRQKVLLSATKLAYTGLFFPVFAVDEISSYEGQILPKFNSFMDERMERFRSVQIKLQCVETGAQPGRTVFYSMFNSIDRFNCETLIVTVYFNATCMVQVLFPVSEDAWKYPECVIAENPANSDKLLKSAGDWTDGDAAASPSVFIEWSTQNAVLVGLNRTHAICDFKRSGIYAILIRPDHGALVNESINF